MIKIIQGNCIDKLKDLDDESVQCVVTSPPYWGLRDYGTATWEGGDENCEHLADRSKYEKNFNDSLQSTNTGTYARDIIGKWECPKCKAIRIDDQLGLEETPQEYVQSLVNVFREVKRVLKDDGTVWLNLGDSYVGTGHKGDSKDPKHPEGRNAQKVALNHKVKGLKPKDLVGIPWRVAFALQDDGWYLRQDIIWAKPNPMPESVQDRCTKSHEYIFLLTKNPKYYYDTESIKEESMNIGETNAKFSGNKYGDNDSKKHLTYSGNKYTDNGKRNKRDVWTITTKPYSEAHFATFPTEIPELCIKAGTSEHGQCSNCKKPYIREIEREKNPDRDMESQRKYYAERTGRTDGHISGPSGLVDSVKFIGWIPDCDCKAEVQPQVVLDMFAGAGTTGLVADRLGRDSILIELNKDYIKLIEDRLRNDAPMFTQIEK
tara:strand:- start:623 stop:1918 length:1296 start_codon:yes stop_codon:yes gene_type:complete